MAGTDHFRDQLIAASLKRMRGRYSAAHESTDFRDQLIAASLKHVDATSRCTYWQQISAIN